MAAVVIGCLAVAAAGQGASAGDGQAAAMKRLLVVAGGKAAHARVGSYCLRSGGSAPGSTSTLECTSVAYDPHPKPAFRVAGGSMLVLCAGRPAKSMRVALVQDSRNGPTQLSTRRATALDDAGQCWRSKLPRRLGRATSADVRVGYGSAGSAHFVVGLVRRSGGAG